jgi:hypothetical protein
LPAEAGPPAEVVVVTAPLFAAQPDARKRTDSTATDCIAGKRFEDDRRMRTSLLKF